MDTPPLNVVFQCKNFAEKNKQNEMEIVRQILTACGN